MLRWRLLLGTLVIVTLIVLCWLDARATMPGVWLLPLVLLFTVLATHEMLNLLAAGGMRPVAWIVYLLNVSLVVLPWLGECCGFWPRFATHNVSEIAMNLGVAVFILLLAEMGRFQQPGGHTANIAGGIFALFYIGAMLAMAVTLRLTCGIGAMISWILVVKMGDTGAYAVGRLIGRHKLTPRISPGKTIEGAIGDLAFSCFGAWLAFHWLVPLSQPELQGPWWGWIGFGLLVGIAGMVGDLAESLLKRDVGIKDSSTWLPGFGGILDIVDSLLLSAPVAYFCWTSGMVGR